MVDTWLTRRKLRKAIKEFRPDTIVSVYPLASLVLGRMRRTKMLRVPVVTYLTDFAVHSLWVHPGIDRHLAVSELSAAGGSGARRQGRACARGPLVGERFRDAEYRPGRGAQRARPRTRRPRGARRRRFVGRRRRPRHRRGDRAVGRVPPDHRVRPGREAAGRAGESRLRDRHRLDRRDARAHDRGRRARGERRRTHVHGGVRGRPARDHVPPDRGARQGQRRDDGALGRQPLRARRGGAARLGSARSPRPVPHARSWSTPRTGSSSAIPPTTSPSSPRRRSTSSTARVDGRVPAPARAASRSRWPPRASSCSTSGSPSGAQAVSAIGVGVAKPPKGRRARVYIGVRLDDDQLADRCSSACDRRARRVGGGRRADAEATALAGLDYLAHHGVDIANGGGARARCSRWNQARNDLDKAGKVIAQEAGEPAHEFVSGPAPRRLRPVLLPPRQAAARGAGPHVRSERPARGARRPEGVPARRSRPRTRSRWRSRSRFQRRGSSSAGLVAHPSGSSAEVERREARRDRGGRVGVGAFAVVHATPALAGVSPIGVRVTPRLVGVGRRGHVALTFDDGPDPESTPEFLAVLDELGWRATFFMLGDMVRRRRRRARGRGGRTRGRGARRPPPQHAAPHAACHRRRHRARLRHHRRRHRYRAARGSGRRSASCRSPRCVPRTVTACRRCCGPRGVATGAARRRPTPSSPTSRAATSTAARCCCTTPTASRTRVVEVDDRRAATPRGRVRGARAHGRPGRRPRDRGRAGTTTYPR